MGRREDEEAREKRAVETVAADVGGCLGELRGAATELTLAAKGVKNKTKSVGEEGVLSEEAVDVAHRIQDLERPTAAAAHEQAHEPESAVGKEPTALPDDDLARALIEVLAHLGKATALLEGAARAMEPHLTAPREPGQLAEEIVDVAHRVADRRDRRQRELDTRTGAFFETEDEGPRQGGLLSGLFD